nr:inositol monophosphatase family protein [uncultured Gellertiella sp.]
MTDQTRLGPQDLSARLDIAEQAARAAGLLLVGHYGTRDQLAIEQKGRNDFVSNADREAEAVISGLIRAAFPQDGFLGEETGMAEAGNPDVIWCVDPLDGTTNFLKGAHNWCVSIGLWAHGVPVLGVIYDPVRDELFTGSDHHPATCNGKPIRVSDIDSFDRTALGLGRNQRVGPEAVPSDMLKLFHAGGSFRQVGAGALMLAYVAAGRVDGYFERHMWAWDAVAGLALIRAAGGVIEVYPEPGGSVAAGALTLASGPGLFAQLKTLFELA